MPSSEVVAVTAELCGRTFSPAAAAVFVSDLDGYPDAAVLRALVRCRREIRGVLTPSDVIQRIDDGRPGVEEAWAMLPRDEDATVVWTEEMTRAWGIALPLLKAGEDIPARMAFKEAYSKAVSEARDLRRPVCWSVTLGKSPLERAQAVTEAVEKGRLTADYADRLLAAPETGSPMQVLLETGNAVPLLTAAGPGNGAAEEAIESIKGFLKRRVSCASA
jgi:hypothetical protein